MTRRIFLIALLMLIPLVLAVQNTQLPPTGPTAKPATTPAGGPPVGGQVFEAAPGVVLPNDPKIIKKYFDTSTTCPLNGRPYCWQITGGKVDVTGDIGEKSVFKPGVYYNNGKWTLGKDSSTFYANGRIQIDQSGNILQLQPDGKMKATGGKVKPNQVTNVQVMQGQPVVSYTSPTGQERVKISGIDMDQGTFDRYSSIIDYSKPPTTSGDTQTFTLANGDTLNYIPPKDGNSFGTSVVISTVDNKALGRDTIYISPDGETYEADDGWKLEGTSIINPSEDARITMENNGRTTVRASLKNPEDRVEITNLGNGETAKNVFEDDGDATSSSGRRTSYETFNADKRRTSVGEVNEEGKITEIRRQSTDELFASRETSYCFGGPSECNVPKNNYWVDPTGTRVCRGSQAQCLPPQAEPREGEARKDPYKGAQWGDTDDDTCTKDPNCQKAADSKETNAILRGETQTQQKIGQVLNFRPGWQGLSSWLMPEETSKWRKFGEKTFGDLVVTEYAVADAVCDYDRAHVTQQDGENAAFIQLPGGATQHVGSIQAEKAPSAGPTLCAPELPCQVGDCNEEGLCMKDGQIIQSTFYKVSWGVTAPYDEDHTPFIDENGVAVRYNVKLIGAEGTPSVWLYPANVTGDANSLELKNGEADRDVYVAYSTGNYVNACVIFGAPPEDRAGDPVDKFCSKFIESTRGSVKFQRSADKGPSGSTKVSKAGRKQI